MIFLKWSTAFALVGSALVVTSISRAAEPKATPVPAADTNLILNGSFDQWLPPGTDLTGSGFEQHAPLGWKSRTHVLTMNKGKQGAKATDYTYLYEPKAGGIQHINAQSKSLFLQVKSSDVAYRIFQDIAIEPGTYLFSGGLGVAGRTSRFPSAVDHPGSPIPWKITLELLDQAGKRVLLANIATAVPVASSATPEAKPFKPVPIVVPAGAVRASLSIWCFGGLANGRVDDLKLVKQAAAPAR